jgi:hypothetical protein
MGSRVNLELVKDLKAKGAHLHLWSRGGADYAKSTAIELGIEQCFISFLSKPDVLLDDVRIEAFPFKQFHPNECFAISAEELLRA